MTAPQRPTCVSDTIIVDEVGIESGVYCDYRLKSAYQPIFEREGRFLRPVAVDGLIWPCRNSMPEPPIGFFRRVPSQDQPFIESMCRALHLRNYCNIGVDGLDLFFNYDPRANPDLDETLDEIQFTGQRLGEIGLDLRLLVCEITEAEAIDEKTLASLVNGMRKHGIRIAIDDFGSGRSTPRRVDLLKPEIVKIEGAWFRILCRDPATVELFGAVVKNLQRQGARVLVEGIEDAAQLGVALGAGGDLFQGHFLAPPALVGTVFDETPLPIAERLRSDLKVVRLFG